MQPTAQQIEQQIGQKIPNAQTLKDLLECLETIERKIWRNRHFKKPYIYDVYSEYLDRIRRHPLSQELKPILDQYINTKSVLENLEDKSREFIFSSLFFVISSTISLLCNPTESALSGPANTFFAALMHIGTIFAVILPIEIFIFCLYLLLKPKQIKHKAFYEFALKKL